MLKSQAEKAEIFREQHLSGKLLILPNIWDVTGAKLMELSGYPSVATASVATAMVNGFGDGEKIPFVQLLDLVKKISHAVEVPVTVDIERGFADTIPRLKDNVRLLIEHGAVGINIEDSLADHQGFYSVAVQCRKIESIRETAIQFGVNLVINARTDFMMLNQEENALDQAIDRAKQYKLAGADCVYPILISSYDDIARFREETIMPMNVILLKPIADLRKLEQLGVARISLGPQLLNHALLTMKDIAEGLLEYNTGPFFSRELLPREFMNRLV